MDPLLNVRGQLGLGLAINAVFDLLKGLAYSLRRYEECGSAFL